MVRTHRSRLTIAWLSAWLCAVWLAAPTPGRGATGSSGTERWDIFEITLTGPASDNPYVDVRWSATFRQGDQSIAVPGFWDGAGTYKVRFSPPATGEWHYQTHSATPELNGKTGAFTATAPTRKNHGPVQVFNTYYLRYADGTPYHQFGTTCYAWVHQTRELQGQTLQTLAAAPFNKIRFCVFPKSYVYNQNEPEFFAFKKGADGKFDFNHPDPAFWRHFEQRLLDLQRLGIEADLILWHPYDRWGFADMSDEEDDRYLRYCIARLSAYRNVWWSLANEYDFMTNVPKGHRGNKQWEDWDRFFSILQKEDPHQRLRGIHNGRKWYDHTKDWVTHASLQTSDMEGGVRFRAQYRKPVVYDECKYEGDIPQGWGNLTARDMAQRFWLGTLSGCYVGHGETYRHPQDILWWAKGGVLHGQSPQRIQWLKDFMAAAPAFHELKPIGDGKGTFVLAKESEYYLVYCLDQRPQRVRLAGSRPYKLDLIDPWEMTVSSVGTASPGEYTFAAPKPDSVYRFTPLQPGETLRAEARSMASVTEASRHRVIVSTDIGGTDPDDFQSMVHLLVHADRFDIEGLVSSPYGPGRKEHILQVIDLYERDYANLRTHSEKYPAPEALRAVTKQGALEGAGFAGFGAPTEGSDWIVRCARRDDPRPLWVLVWGGIEDLAQALHDAPEIEAKLRVYFIGGPNKKWSVDAYQYIVTHHPRLWIIEANATYRGWFVGGNQEGRWGNKAFVATHVAGHGALGDFFATQLGGTLKMGDSPSVGYLLHGTPEDPSQGGWGGRFVRAWERPHTVFQRLTGPRDRIEQFGVFELALPLGAPAPAQPEAHLAIENQESAGAVDANGVMRWRFSPKDAKTYRYTIRSKVPALDGKTGALTSFRPSPDATQRPSLRLPQWWTDDPASEAAEGPHLGARTVSRWRADFLRDFAARMDRCRSPAAARRPRG